MTFLKSFPQNVKLHGILPTYLFIEDFLVSFKNDFSDFFFLSSDFAKTQNDHPFK